jgi:hypothetical protein
LGKRVSALKEAGATWVIFGWPVDLDELVAAARDARRERSEGRTSGPYSRPSMTSRRCRGEPAGM